MTTVAQTFNRTDVEQTQEDLGRIRRDKENDPGASPAAFKSTTGETLAVPGDIAPYARVPPLPTPEQAYGREDQVIGFVPELLDPADTTNNTLPILDVEQWRKITFTLRYTAGAEDGVLAVTPLYGNNEQEFPLPLFTFNAALTVDGEYGYRTMYKEQFRTPATPINNVFEIKLTFDVSAYRIFALSVREMNEDITCDGEEPACSRFTLRYSLSM